MRDPNKLAVFKMADLLVEEVYRATAGFPDAERYGLTSQIRRASVSVPSNLVEGCTRESGADFRRFVEIAAGSAAELQYQLSLSIRLGFPQGEKMDGTEVTRLVQAEHMAQHLCKAFNGFLRVLREES